MEATITQIPSATGYRTRVRTREFVCEWPDLAPDDGSPPLTATVKQNLTFEEIDAIPNVFVPDPNGERLLISVNEETRRVIAPFVLAWNAVAVDQKTGTVYPVPPPAEMGPDAFRVVDWMVAGWLAVKLKNIHRSLPDLDEKKEPAGSMDATSADTDSA